MIVISNPIIESFINCPYKAYQKQNGQIGSISEYENLYNRLKQTQLTSLQEQLSLKNKLAFNFTLFSKKEGIGLSIKFENDNICLTLDGIELIGKKTFVPILVTPFEKVTSANKLFIALQAAFIQTNFGIQAEHAKVVYGQNLKETKFKLASLSKVVKKQINDINKCLSNTNAPNFYKNAHCQTCEFENKCLEKLKERDDLSLLTGLKPTEIANRNNRGIFSVKQLSYLFRPKKNPNRKRRFIPELKALAIREKKTLILELPTLKEVKTEIFLDFEGIPDRNFNYLIGLIVRTGDNEKEYLFWANTKEDETGIFIQLIEIIKTLNNFIIYHYGSYETQVLKYIAKILPSKYQENIKLIIDNCYNLLNIFSQNFYPPTYSNSLKEIARFLKFEWTEQNASGLQSLIWRYDWERTKEDYLKKKLTTYNLEDCKALLKIKDWIIVHIENIDFSFEKADNYKKEFASRWGKVDFLVEGFEKINSSAYFNYQREKILIKTYPKLKAKSKKKFDLNLSLSHNKILTNESPKNCKNCNSEIFYKHSKESKKIVDLKITSNGIKRHVILYENCRYRCAKCKKIIHPSIKGKFGITLHDWIINQIIHYRNSYNQVSEQLFEYFGISISATKVLNTKSDYAASYQITFNEILDLIKNSNVLHIDETVFHIRKVSCYIWVFTSINTVYYLFKPTREAEFLKELLKEFKGVLISDFYAGYDGVNCPKQRCLIHLIRDFNDDFVKNQLNVEFKSIVIKISNLLSEIMETINRHGLKKRFLRKHKTTVDKFFKELEKCDFESELCFKWKKRLISSRSELFTFLDYDGIPWNNNNAEAAIKAIAVYRRENDGIPTQKGIQDYLTLLSIEQTCKYRGLSFFEFLRSGEKSIEKFNDIKRKKRK